MSHGPEHHIEHAEHAAHAAHDPFETRVILSITILAALLAAVTMLSHRAHNATLQLQLKANDSFTEASNQWNYFQSKKNRQYLYETADLQSDILLAIPVPKTVKEDDEYKSWQDASKKRKADEWQKRAARYEKETKEIQKHAEGLTKEAEEYRERSAHVHHAGDTYDMAELGVEIGLVLCSLAVLTKRYGFWYGGLTCSLIGIVLAAVGLYQQYVILAAHH